jgi:hypothetical protein
MSKKSKLTLNLMDDQDYVLGPEGRCWITVGKLSVHLVKTDEGLVVDIYALGKETEEPLATTYVFDAEADEEEDAES